MYQRVDTSRTARSDAGAIDGSDPRAAAERAAERVRKLLTAYVPNLPFDRASLRSTLEAPLPAGDREAERWFALGWVCWLDGDFTPAEAILADAVRLARSGGAVELLAEAAYWRARVQNLLGRPDAVDGFEEVLRTLDGSPRATAWFVDLLWRSGRVDRAEQVWKSVRGNRRISACEEGPLLEARVLLRRGEVPPAQRLLEDMTPRNGVLFVERLLLLAWILTAQKRPEQALKAWQQACEGPYPVAALDAWRALVEHRCGGPPPSEAVSRPPAALRDWLHGQQERKEGRLDRAAEAYRAVLAFPAARPFARYALAGRGAEDYAALLAAQPGLFLAVRCRLWSVLERFRRRRAMPAEYLDVCQLAATAGYHSDAADHFRRLALALQQKSADAEGVRSLVSDAETAEPARRRNLGRVALELAAARLPPEEAGALFRAWLRLEWIVADESLRSAIARQGLRASLLGADRVGPEVCGEWEKWLPEEPLVAIAGSVPPELPPDAHPALRLLHAAARLGAAPDGIGEAWREGVRALRSEARWKPLAQALLLGESARRQDASTAARLLDDADSWRGFTSAPPAFAVRAAAGLASAHPGNPDLRYGLSRWLRLWDLNALGAEGATLASQVGLILADEGTAPPAGPPPAAWYLHQAVRALAREDGVAALACARRAIALDPDLATVPNAEIVRAALPELERRARARALAGLLPTGRLAAPIPAGLLDGMVRELESIPEGRQVFGAIERGDPGARAALAALSDRPDLSPRLVHHLALFEHRAALAHEVAAEAEAAESCFRRAWRCWLCFLAASLESASGGREPPVGTHGGLTPPARQILLNYLLAVHRRHINKLLAQNTVDSARRHWDLVQDLPALAASLDETLGRDLGDRVDRFREELATEYLLATREGMRFGDVPEGWHADYEKGLALLRRLLSLDRDNPRLLTALVEVCDEWFLDLYNAGDRAGLAAQVARFTPFALQLARLAEGRPGDLAARAALADFLKFRGFLAPDRAEKEALYREALRFDPANRNVRDLLAGLDPPAEE
jgi:hypothetical protein